MARSVVQRIRAHNGTRMPSMVALKYRFMCENMFRFFRGTCHIFYDDLSRNNTLPYSPHVWISGDLHIENFGSFKGDNRQVYFDLNDFDEAVLAPATWELARMVTSILIAFQSLKIGQRKALKIARLFLKAYTDTLSFGKPNYIDPRTASGIVCDFLTAVSRRKPKRLLQKRTVHLKDGVVIAEKHPKHLALDDALKNELSLHINQWLENDSNSPYNYKVIDAVFRVAGTGSMGLKRYAILLKSLNENGEKYILLDMKQSVESSIHGLANIPQPKWSTPAERVVAIQQVMQNRFPALLSTTIFKGDSYIVQEMQPEKDNINFKLLKDRYRDMCRVIADMGMLTASAQLRSCGRFGSSIADDLVAFGQDTNWQNAVLDYAVHYSNVVKGYYRSFKATGHK